MRTPTAEMCVKVGVRFSLETHSGLLSGFSQAPKTGLMPVRELGTRILRKQW